MASPVFQLAGIPKMFGDFFGQSGQLAVSYYGEHDVLNVDIPPAGGARRMKVAEDNKAVTMDRVYFVYNHFQNALRAEPDVFDPLPRRDFSVER
ncbi:MAG TPA: hypothetical protein EYP56_03415 [Planctomycetaceae bacterium]|nr:hypothetical protein [Planctomycetaceae bacterium]